MSRTISCVQFLWKGKIFSTSYVIVHMDVKPMFVDLCVDRQQEGEFTRREMCDAMFPSYILNEKDKCIYRNIDDSK